jgi:hypothetical protein
MRREDPGAYASPMIAEFDGDRQAVTVTQHSVSLADGPSFGGTRGSTA